MKPAKYAGEGTFGFGETTSTFKLSRLDRSQQVRSPAVEGKGQFGPQQGASIAASASATPQPNPAGIRSASASNAKTAFTKKRYSFVRLFATSGIQLARCLLSDWALARDRSMLSTKALFIRDFFYSLLGIAIAWIRHYEADLRCRRARFAGRVSPVLTTNSDSASRLESRNASGHRDPMRGPIQFSIATGEISARGG